MTKIYFAEIVCPALDLPDGEIEYNEDRLSPVYPVGTIATSSCNDGYDIRHGSPKTCQINGEWSGGHTSCVEGNEMYFLGWHMSQSFLSLPSLCDHHHQWLY